MPASAPLIARTASLDSDEIPGLLEELDTLRRHVADQQVLAASAVADGEAPPVADLASADRAWLPEPTCEDIGRPRLPGCPPAIRSRR